MTPLAISVAAELVTTAIAAALIVRGLQWLRQQRLEQQIRALPPLSGGELCKTCEDARADPQLTAYYPNPIPAVLLSTQNFHALCATCSIVDMAMSKADRAATIAALKQRQSVAAR